MCLAGSDRSYVLFIREFESPSPLAHAHISFTLASAAETRRWLRQSLLNLSKVKDINMA